MLNWLFISKISCSTEYSVPVSLVRESILRIISKSTRICIVARLDGSDSSRIVDSMLSMMTLVISENLDSSPSGVL